MQIAEEVEWNDSMTDMWCWLVCAAAGGSFHLQLNWLPDWCDCDAPIEENIKERHEEEINWGSVQPTDRYHYKTEWTDDLAEY